MKDLYHSKIKIQYTQHLFNLLYLQTRKCQKGKAHNKLHHPLDHLLTFKFQWQCSSEEFTIWPHSFQDHHPPHQHFQNSYQRIKSKTKLTSKRFIHWRIQLTLQPRSNLLVNLGNLRRLIPDFFFIYKLNPSKFATKIQQGYFKCCLSDRFAPDLVSVWLQNKTIPLALCIAGFVVVQMS